MKITTGKIEGAQKVLVYGPEGIGKSTFAAQFPDPLFIDTEGSTRHMDVKRLDTPSSWTMLMQEVLWVIANPGVCKTLVIDTADWAEQLCIRHVCSKSQKDGIEDFGYGKGYTYLAEEYGVLLNTLSDLVERGVHVVLTAHAQIRKFEQPDETAAYDRWELKLQKKTAPLVKEWCDMVLFANYKTFAVKNEDKKAKAAGGKRVLYTSHMPAWDAKNRHGFAEELSFEFSAIASAIRDFTPVVTSPPVAVPAETKPAPAETKPAPAETPAAPAIPADIPAHLKALYDLMAANGVTETAIRNAVFKKGYFPKETAIEKYPVDFVQGVLITAWDQLHKFIREEETVPFN